MEKKKGNRVWVFWGIMLIITGLVWFEEGDGPTYSVPKPIFQTDTIKIPLKKYDKEEWQGYDDDSLRQLYDPNHPDFDYDPNDPNRGEWDGYY